MTAFTGKQALPIYAKNNHLRHAIGAQKRAKNMRQLIAANWKMHGDLNWADKISELGALATPQIIQNTDLLICPPLSLLAALHAVRSDEPVSFGAQNCHAATNGAFTGEVSADMVSEIGASYVILGHSERRQYCGETDESVMLKAKAVHAAGLIAIICIGESLKQREAGRASDVVKAQLIGSVPDSATSMNTVIAYEPIWAIGTGKVPSLEDIRDIHQTIRMSLSGRFGEASADLMPILYGGSVKPSNSNDILGLPNVDGALIGGASLEMDSFMAIAASARPYNGE